MIRLTTLLISAAALLSLGHALELDEIPLTRTDGSHHYLVEATVEGRKMELLVDSGAGMPLVLSKETAEAIGKIGEETDDGDGVGGAAAMQRFDVNGFALGDHRFRKLTCFSVELRHAELQLDGKLFPPKGLVGVGMLKLLNAVIDTRHRKLLLPPDGAAPGDYLDSLAEEDFVTLKMDEGEHDFAFIDIEIEGETYAFLVDIGAGTNSLEPAVAEKFGLTLSEDGRDIGGAGKHKVMNARRTEVENPVIAGKVKLPKMSFEVHPLAGVKPPGGKPLGGLIGSRTLSMLQSRVDFGSYRIIVPRILYIRKPK